MKEIEISGNVIETVLLGSSIVYRLDGERIAWIRNLGDEWAYCVIALDIVKAGYTSKLAYEGMLKSLESNWDKVREHVAKRKIIWAETAKFYNC